MKCSLDAKCPICQGREADFWVAAKKWLEGRGVEISADFMQVRLATAMALRDCLAEEIKLLGGRT